MNTPETDGAWVPVLGGSVRLNGVGDIVLPVSADHFELEFEYRVAVPDVGDAEAAERLAALAPGGRGRPAGEWNSVLVRLTPKLGEVFLNGFWQVTCPRGHSDWEARFARGPFVRVPASFPEGSVFLENAGLTVDIRGLRMRATGPGGPAPPPLSTAATFEPAFTYLEWNGFEGVDGDGRPQSLRPIVLTHAGDGSGRTFVATQDGVIHSWRQGERRTRIFLDLRDRVSWQERANEEGFLGLAFHPGFTANGELFVCYTSAAEPHTTIVSRFRRVDGDAESADPESEERLLVIPKQHGNHNGGTLCFGPDRMLYIAVGDGGGQFDPDGNGQDLDDLFGSILRIDVDRRDEGLAYAIPADNPFVSTPGARGEIYAYGFRNVWRMAFDRADGRLWAADVGQLICEEIDIVERGGNYGWGLMEGTRSHGRNPPPPNAALLPPVFEYDHAIGGSIVGGLVYRGTAVPALAGRYIYADHVTGECFGLDYDRVAARAVGTVRIPSRKLPVLSFGEDEAGEVYAMVASNDGRGLYRLVAGSDAQGSAAAAPRAHAEPSGSQRPNIILILVDDMGYGDLGCHGNPVFQTPHIDQLHRESVRFTDFCVSATCSPTRAALITGRHEFRGGVVDTVGGREKLTLDSVTLPERLRKAGYTTGLFGKWHLGATGRRRPELRGFDRVVTSPGDTQRNAIRPTLLHDGEPRQHAGYREDVLFDEAVAFIERSKDRPFFCMIPTYAPHAPLVAEPSALTHVSLTFPKATPAAFYGMITTVDANIGKLLRRLGELALDEQTIVILITDNGGTYGVDHSNGNMRGCKGAAWFGGSRAVSFWRWPGKWRPRDVAALAAHVDVMPTLCDLAGCEDGQPADRPFDGVSLSDCLADDKAPPARLVFQHVGRWPRGKAAEHAECFCGVRDGPLLLVRAAPCADPECRGMCRSTVPWRREKGYTEDFAFHYALTPDRDWALYDVHADPQCRENLAPQRPRVAEKLKHAYGEWWAEVAPVVVAADEAAADHSTLP